MHIAVLGLWHLGCVYAAGSAHSGHCVVGYDPDPSVVTNLLSGRAPLFEPGLEDEIRTGLSTGRLRFAGSLKEAVQEADIVWITFDTPVDEQDRADCGYVIDQIRATFPYARQESCILVSSQLPVGTGRMLEGMAREAGRNDLHFACSPENLRLGQALKIFLEPDRVICGYHQQNTYVRNLLEELWSPITKHVEWMSVESAEMTKHAINAFLATSVAFANEISSLCEISGADAKEVERGLKTESRIGPKAYVGPGLAFAGGTLARDIRFLSDMGSETFTSLLFPSVWQSNNRHKHWVEHTLIALLGELAGKRFALWGLTYKVGTDTLRRSSALEYAKTLHNAGAEVRGFDPAVERLPQDVEKYLKLACTPLEAAQNADAVILCTPWPMFLDVDFDQIRGAMRRPLIVDPVRFLAEHCKPHCFEYAAIGLPL